MTLTAIYRDAADDAASQRKRKRYAKGYRPLDERLEDPRIRMLRSLVRGGPAEFGELMDRLDVAPAHEYKQRYDAYVAAMARMVKRREATIKMVRWRLTYSPFSVAMIRTYNITALGRRRLARELAPDRIVIE